MSRKTAVLAAVGAVAVLGTVAAIDVPAANGWIENRHQQTSSYATGARAKEKRVSVPR
ncbi:hypothetical protein ACFVX6_01785 [Streptomyces sp. NPDC058289]|uniref:hypothetical protein n=1 Tax=Streptomyces sp. NPDC058289 TaxID=3346425 RepID=UPI0036E4BFD8